MTRNRQTRRDFFKTGSALAAAGLAAPYFFSSTSASRRAKQRREAGRRLDRRGRTRLGYRRPGGPLGHTVACCDVHLGNAHRFAEQIERPRSMSIRTTAKCWSATTCRR